VLSFSGPAVSSAPRHVLNDPPATRTVLPREKRSALRGTTLTTPPMAPLPYNTDEGPPSTSIRSTVQGSNGKVTVPAPTNN
jgi:hypothetical protein